MTVVRKKRKINRRKNKSFDSDCKKKRKNKWLKKSNDVRD